MLAETRTYSRRDERGEEEVVQVAQCQRLRVRRGWAGQAMRLQTARSPDERGRRRAGVDAEREDTDATAGVKVAARTFSSPCTQGGNNILDSPGVFLMR
ncbi:MAG: hypothetical protein WKH64_19335 [Chloroflexia bacterium]